MPTKKVLVTGGAGFIGTNVVHALLEKGYEVTIFDNFDKGKREYLKSLDIEIVCGDLRNFDEVLRVSKGKQAIFHLAAYGSVIESIEDPDTNFQINVKGTLNILKSSVKNDIEKLVFSSTGGALMGNTPPPVNEKSVPKPISPYGASKLACEGYCSAFTESYDLDCIIFRFSNVYGPWSAHKKGVFNKFLHAIDTNKKLIVYGKSTRDFIYAEDLANGLVSGLEYKTTPGDIFHLSTNQGVKIESLAKLMLKLHGKSNDYILLMPGRKGEVIENFAQNDKAKKQLDFDCPTKLRNGLEKTIKWFNFNQHLWK